MVRSVEREGISRLKEIGNENCYWHLEYKLANIPLEDRNSDSEEIINLD